MKKEKRQSDLQNLPACAVEFIKLVVKKMRYRKKVRQDVQAELAAHFEDELKDYTTDEEKEQKAQQLIAEFGDMKLLAVLMRRAKKRCRPLWRTVVARTFQTVGVLIVLFCFYTVWLLTGKPTISVDYLAVLNQMSRLQLQDESNAWPHYEKAIALFVEPDGFDIAPEHIMTEEELQKIRKWVETNKAAWQEFAAGSLKSYCHREYQYDPNVKDEDKSLFNILSFPLRPIRGLTRLGIWRARMQIDANQPQQAVEDCLSIARFGSHWQGKGILIEQLVGIAAGSRARDEMLNIAGTKELSPIDLKRFQQQLLQIYPQGYPFMNVEGERLLFMDAVQRIFTDGGPGGGHIIPDRWMIYYESITNPPQSDGILPFIAAAMVQAGRDKTMNKGNEFYDRMEKHAKISPYERHTGNPNDFENMISSLSPYRYLLIYILMPAVDRISEIAYRGRALHQATVTVLALKQWRLEKNEYPANLDELVMAGYLKEPPMDPFSNESLIYKKTDDGFILYSVGLNFTDDGGKSGKDSEGRIKRWADNGDNVFWPVPKSEVNR